VLALDFGGSKMALALCRRDGGHLAEMVLETEPAAGARSNLERAVAAGRSLVESSSEPLCAVGACTFGIPLDNGVALSPAVPGWDELPVRRLLQEAFAVPVAVMNDVKAAARAEVRHGSLQGANPALYLNLGTGLAAALVHNGEVIDGAHGAAGEIGYNLRAAKDVWQETGSGTKWSVLEDVVSGMGLSKAVGKLTGDGSGSYEAAEVFEKALAEPAYEQVLDEFLTELSYHLVNLAVAFDPARIAVGGGMVGSWELLVGPLTGALGRHVPYPPELVMAAFPHDAALRGAIDIGLELADSLEERTTQVPA
jgi:glucokinase